jgi:glyoxylase-like metal-dependent hydrolase (beta-lactamase superfamily II)
MRRNYFSINQIDDGIYHIFDPATDLPIIFVNSHGHMDHIGGNWQFGSAYIHENDISIAKLHSSREMKQRTIKYLQEQKLPPKFEINYIFPLNFSYDEFMDRKQPEFLSIPDRYIFDIGKRELEVVHIPGHTKGGIGLLDRKSKILLAGDSVNPFLWMFLEESTSINTLITSLERLKSMSFDKIIGAHMLEVLPKEFIDKLILCASNIDVNKSEPFYSPLVEKQGLIYAEGGKPFVDSDFVSIVFSEDKLDK